MIKVGRRRAQEKKTANAHTHTHSRNWRKIGEKLLQKALLICSFVWFSFSRLVERAHCFTLSFISLCTMCTVQEKWPWFLFVQHCAAWNPTTNTIVASTIDSSDHTNGGICTKGYHKTGNPHEQSCMLFISWTFYQFATVKNAIITETNDSFCTMERDEGLKLLSFQSISRTAVCTWKRMQSSQRSLKEKCNRYNIC